MDKDQMEAEAGVGAPLAEGLGKLQILPPSPSPGGGAYAASEMNRSEEEEEDPHRVEVMAGDEVNVQVQVISKKVNAIPAGAGGDDCGGTRLRSLAGTTAGAVMDNEQACQEGEENRKEAPPTADGLRRSRRLQNLPSRNPIGDGGGSAESGGYTGSDRKMKRVHQEEAKVEEVTRKNPAGEGDDDGVNASSVQVDPKQPTPNLGSGGRQEEEEANNEINKVPLPHHGIVPVKVKGEEGASSLLVVGKAVAAGRSEIMSPEKSGDAHPCLFIENVMDVIFKHIIDQPGPKRDVAQDVQNARLVCKTWKNSVTRIYRRTRATASFDKYEQQNSYRYRKSLTQFVGTMRTSEMIPVQKFKFCGSVFHHDNLEMFKDFLVFCGPEAVSLQIQVNSSGSERIMANLENLAEIQLLKLKTLKLEICLWGYHHFDGSQIHGSVKLVEFLLVAAKILGKFQLSCPPCFTPAYRIQQELVLQLLTRAIADGLPRTVKELKLKLDLNESGFNALAGIQPQLERFQFNIINPTLGRRTLYQFLRSQAATLRHVRIYPFVEIGDGIFVEFPRLDELVHLDMPDSTVSTTVPSNFAETFPKLQCLKIPKMKPETNFLAFLSSVKKPSRSLQFLHLPTWNCTAIAPIFREVAKSFPCLTELRVRLLNVTKGIMGEIFTYFENLEVLDISLHFTDQTNNVNWLESVFSGISESDCFRIKRLQDFDNEDVKELQRQASILNMTRLRKLVINTSWGIARWFRFTDFSAHFVFLEMNHLREIHLPNWVVELSPRYLELVRDKLVLHG